MTASLSNLARHREGLAGGLSLVVRRGAAATQMSASEWAGKELDRTGRRADTRSARQVALGRRTGEGADPGEQLALGEWAALLDLDQSLAAVAVVIRADLLGEVLNHLAITYQQEIIVDRHRLGDLIEEGPHVFIAMAFAARVLLGGWSSG